MRRTQKEIQKEIVKYKVQQEGDNWVGYRICPSCGEKLKYSTTERYTVIRNIRNAENKKGTCIKCSMTGEKNHFYGKNHSKKTIKKISKSRKGKGCGENNSMAKKEHREKVSIALKEKYASGELNFLRKIQSETAKKSQAEGKIKTFPISKAEIEIKKFIEDLGHVVEPQFRIGSLKYDFLIKKLNIIIEYNGDYWHCNPKKIIFNKRKNNMHIKSGNVMKRKRKLH